MPNEPIVNIHADGKLVYTGFLTQAALRCGIERTLLLSQLMQHEVVRVKQPKEKYEGYQGFTTIPRATVYTASLKV